MTSSEMAAVVLAASAVLGACLAATALLCGPLALLLAATASAATFVACTVATESARQRRLRNQRAYLSSSRLRSHPPCHQRGPAPPSSRLSDHLRDSGGG